MTSAIGQVLFYNRTTSIILIKYFDMFIHEVSDLMYLCSPFSVFDIRELEDADVGQHFEVTLYAPFGGKEALHSLLDPSVVVSYVHSYDKIKPSSSSDIGYVDGTVKGLVLAYKEFLQKNLEMQGVDCSDFVVSVTETGYFETNSDIIRSMQDQQLLPSSLFGIMDLLTYRVPVYEALFTVSKSFTEFIEPDYYRLSIRTNIGVFERKELFGSYGLVVDSLQGFIQTFVGGDNHLKN